jgi:hypothetical protein
LTIKKETAFPEGLDFLLYDLLNVGMNVAYFL